MIHVIEQYRSRTRRDVRYPTLERAMQHVREWRAARLDLEMATEKDSFGWTCKDTSGALYSVLWIETPTHLRLLDLPDRLRLRSDAWLWITPFGGERLDVREKRRAAR